MYAHITTGTLSFLQTLVNKHPSIDYLFMQQGLSTSAYYESNDPKTIFSTGRSYEIISKIGNLINQGYITLDNIPVTGDSIKSFEEQFTDRNIPAFSMPGFVAYRLLKPLKGNMYTLLYAWESEMYYKYWKESDEYKAFYEKTKTRLPAYFADRPFTQTYTIIEEKTE